MNGSKPSPARRVTLGAVLIALSLIALYGATALPTGRLPAYFLASVFVAGLTCENMPMTAFAAYTGTSALSWLMVPDKLALLPYIVFLGWYGVVKYLLECRLTGIVLWVCKLLIFNTSAALSVLFVYKFFAFPLAVQLPLWVVIPLLEGAFICYDVLYSMVASYYVHSIRPRIMQNE